jgi:hypothetical protein
VKAWQWLAGCALAGFLVGVPLLQIAGPNYHNPVPVRVTVAHHAASYVNNPYLPLAPAPTVSHGSAAASGGGGHAGLLRRLLRPPRAGLPRGMGWRPRVRVGRRQN